MPNSDDYNYPTADEPTRDFCSESSESLFAAPKSIASLDVPKEIGAYAIRKMIGSGGMGQVYLAEHQRMQRIVALKMLPMERMADERAVDRFYGEVRAVARLMHPNIVAAFDAGDVDGVHFLAMEYVEGDTLTDLVAKNGPFPLNETAAVIRQAAVGLLHAHRAGIVHRDVKPSNLMRADDGTVKVLDLGLAQISSAGLVSADDPPSDDEKKSMGRMMGTLPYMSPEQLDDADSTDARSDIYSLGATMYFLLAGQPPYVGEFTEIVNGHRQGEIPDLMQIRDDVDMRFANIFNRMLAKSPNERYASLDEVIDDLSEYASQDDAPTWIAELDVPRQAIPNVGSTAGGSNTGSTISGPAKVMAIDLGMFYSASAEASPAGDVQLLLAGKGESPNFRMAISSDHNQLIYGASAMDRRAEHANVVHCLPMYIGKPIVERQIAGRECPPEVLMAMLLRRIQSNSWTAKKSPNATAITVPSSYDQLHRRSVLQAAQLAGLPSVRLVDRSIASVQSLLIDQYGELDGQHTENLSSLDDQIVLFVGVTGQATETAIIRREADRLCQLSSAGHWHTGTLPWVQRLVDLAAEKYVKKQGFDPRKKPKLAARLQMACERAMNSMLLLPSVRIKFMASGKERAVQVKRRDWLKACEDLAMGVRKSIESACEEASVTMKDIDVCVTLGSHLKNPEIRDLVLPERTEKLVMHQLDRTDVARGAAACLAAELPGRRGIAKPPRVITGQTIGILVSDVKGRSRILPIIPKGTSLPARTNRRLSVPSNLDSMMLSLVESSGVNSDQWHTLGNHEFEIGDSKVRVRMISFEVNVNGMLSIRAQTPGTSGSTTLAPLPTPMLSDADITEWTTWLDSLKS